jgi:hypothetical protein
MQVAPPLQYILLPLGLEDSAKAVQRLGVGALWVPWQVAHQPAVRLENNPQSSFVPASRQKHDTSGALGWDCLKGFQE